jgi:predicted DNA-binding protein
MPTTTKQRDEQFVRLPRDLYDKLAEIAAREDRSIAGCVRHIIRAGIAQRAEQAALGAAR